MNFNPLNIGLRCASVFLSPAHAGLIIAAMVAAAAVLLFFIVRNYRNAIRRIESARIGAETADALAKAAAMQDDVPTSDVTDKTDEN